MSYNECSLKPDKGETMDAGIYVIEMPEPVTKTAGPDLISRSHSLAVVFRVPLENALRLRKFSLHLLRYCVGRRLC